MDENSIFSFVKYLKDSHKRHTNPYPPPDMMPTCLKTCLPRQIPPHSTCKKQDANGKWTQPCDYRKDNNCICCQEIDTGACLGLSGSNYPFIESDCYKYPNDVLHFCKLKIQ